MQDSLGVAVIGAGMAGRAHAAAYRIAPTLYSPVLPEIRLVAIGDLNQEFASAAARRFGYQRAETDWRAIAAATDIDVVSVVVANALHREIVEGLLAAGKHVLCEKPLADTLGNARAMAAAARTASSVARVGFTYRRMPGIAEIRSLIRTGVLGDVLHVSGRYWCDYSLDPHAPMSWRYRGAPGTGALADVGSHLAYIAEFLAGDTIEISGGRFATMIERRPVPLGAVRGHEQTALGDAYEAVTNDDYAAYSARFEHGVGSLEVSRVAAGHPNGLSFQVFCAGGAARYSQLRPGEFELYLTDSVYSRNGYRTVYVGPDHPYLAVGQPMDAYGVGVGQNDAFVFQARAFLEEVAGIAAADALPRNASFDDGVHNMELLDAVTASAAQGGAAVRINRRVGV